MAQLMGTVAPPCELDMGSLQKYREYESNVTRWKKILSDQYRRECAQEFVGEVIRTPIADGFAEYIVVSARPLRVVHLDVGDGWNAPRPWIRGLRHEDVAEMIAVEKSIARAMAKNRVGTD